VVGLILLFLTPTILAIGYVYQIRNEKAPSFSVTLYGSDGQELVSDSGNPNEVSPKSLLGIFHQIVTSAKEANIPVESLENAPYIQVKCVLNGTESQWTCYFSLRESDCYCIRSDGKIYAIPSAANKNFLATEYAEVFYGSAVPPTLLTIDNDPVIPTKASWYYQNRNKTFVEAKRLATTDQTLLYEMTGVLDLQFDKIPQSCNVQVYESGKKIFDGSYRDLNTLTTELGSVMELRVQANWDKQSDSDFYGSMEYRFSVQIRNQSHFFINTQEVTPGSLAVLSCTNVTTLSKIRLIPATEGVIPEPIFHWDGDHARALLIFPEHTEAEEFSFTVSYGASEQTFTLTVLPKENSGQLSYPTWTPAPSALSSEARQKWEHLLSSLPKENENGFYFRGNFLSPTDQGYTVGYTHGSQVAFGETLTDSFTALGAEYLSNEANGSRVTALNHGVVILTGETELLGRYVVVDHGGGVRTWYGHLSDCSVEIGNVVKKGDPMGWTGTGGLATGNGVLLLCTVYDTVIDPDFIIGKEILFQTP